MERIEIKKSKMTFCTRHNKCGTYHDHQDYICMAHGLGSGTFAG